MHRRHFLQLSLAVAASASLTGCFKKPPLRTGVHPWIGYETLYLANEFGWLPANVQLVKGQSSRDSLNGMLAGELDAAALTLDEALRLQAGGVPVRAVAVADVSVGADVVMARPEINNLSDLAGRSIAVELSSVSGVMLFAMLEEAGLRSDQVSVIDLPANQHLEAWNQGKIDASVCYQPVASRLAQAGAVALFDSSKIPDTIFDLLVVTRKAEEQQPEAVAALVDAHFRGLQHLVRNRHDAVYRIATRQDVSPESVRQAMATVMLPEVSANRRYLAPGGRVETIARRLGKILAREGLIQRMPDLENLPSRDYLPEDFS